MEVAAPTLANHWLRSAKDSVTRVLRSTGVARRLGSSRWRQRRLLILCYHGVAMQDEHEWDPHLFVTREFLRRRLETIRRGGYVALPLGEAVQRLREGTLPPRSVTLTFDDGCHNFYSVAAPLLEQFGFPATLYLSTHYAVHQRPLRDLAIRYLLWRGRNCTLSPDDALGIRVTAPLHEDASVQSVTAILMAKAEALRPNRERQDEWFARLASQVGVDWNAVLRSRILHLMTMDEVAEMARRGFDIQLHTHRHRTPRNEQQFSREIVENRELIERHCGRPANHFCYPSGDTDPMFLPWLRALRVESATTCSVNLAHADHEPLLLPRFVDTMSQSQLRFESWLDGAASLLQLRKP